MDCKIVLLLAIAVTSCACLPEPAGPWTLEPKCACGRMYLPVCATDGKTVITYSNMCEYKCAASFYQQFLGTHIYIKKENVCDEHDTVGKKY
ncbi:uncharacterized protein LOC123873581 [Maniola jurtina]|uniref:uncharacterized protein LOC123873581 n=1 Tax=Maniola jurtina TaxID=191418 RepID=UPI001E68E089|nr:uncharacterized protein LOC123873581 [Maniola jurtina]